MIKQQKINVFLIVIIAHLAILLPVYAQNDKTEFNKVLEQNLRMAIGEKKKTAAYITLGDHYLNTNIVKSDSLLTITEKVAQQFTGINKAKLILLNSRIVKQNGDLFRFVEFTKLFDKIDNSGFDSKTRAEIFFNQGYYHVILAENRRADKMLDLALKKALSVKSYSLATDILLIKAFKASVYSEKTKAMECAKKALEYAHLLGDKRKIAQSFNAQADIYLVFNQKVDALRKKLLAYDMAGQSSSYIELTRIAMEIGKEQEEIENYSGAKHYYSDAIKYAKLVNDQCQLSNSLCAKANILRLEKNFNESLILNKQALYIVSQIHDKNYLGDIEKLFGQIYAEQKQNKEALIHYKKAVKFFEASRNNARFAEIGFLYGNIYFLENKLDKALDYLLQANETICKYGETDKAYETYPLLSEIYEKKGMYKVSLQYLNDYFIYTKDKLNKREVNILSQLGEDFRTEERDKKIAKQAESLEKQNRIRLLTESKLENTTLKNRLQTYLLVAMLILTAFVAIIGVFRYRQAAIQQKRTQAEMSQTLLRSQMNPHFIFNAMSVIQSYIYDNDVKNSNHFLISFSRLIRLILENSPKEFISIETEIEILNKYLETQKLRFEKRFDYEIICDDELINENAQIPPMITQPFVENSIEHGELHLLTDGKIIIRFSKKGKSLEIEVEDNGVGRKGSKTNYKREDHSSMAMDITEKRIQIINEKSNTIGFLKVTDADNIKKNGTLVLISLPYTKGMIS